MLLPIVETHRKQRVLEHQVAVLSERVHEPWGVSAIVGSSPAIERVRKTVVRLANSDVNVLIRGETGTGKTAAYLLPVMNDISYNRPSHTHTLVLVPTRELALQIDQQIQGLAYTLNITSLAVYGGGEGSAWDQEKAALTRGADIIVATPGRLISHLNLGYVNFSEVQVLVLDEADRMLDIGFHDDIMKIISYVPKKRQTLMFSATMPTKIRSLSKHIMKNPEEISI